MDLELLIALLSGGTLLALAGWAGWARWRKRKNSEIDHGEVDKVVNELLEDTEAIAVLITRVDGGGKGKEPVVGKGLSSTLSYVAFATPIAKKLEQEEKPEKPASYVGIRNEIPEKDVHMLAELIEKGYIRMKLSELPDDELVMCQGKLVGVPGKKHKVCSHCARKDYKAKEGDKCGAMINQKEANEKMGIKRSDVYKVDVSVPGIFYYLIVMYPAEEVAVKEDVIQLALGKLSQLLVGSDSRLN